MQELDAFQALVDYPCVLDSHCWRQCSDLLQGSHLASAAQKVRNYSSPHFALLPTALQHLGFCRVLKSFASCMCKVQGSVLHAPLFACTFHGTSHVCDGSAAA